MKFAVLGAGALGSILAAHLARSGQEVVLLARGARAAQLRQLGVRITGLADFTQAVPIESEPARFKGADYLLVTVKTYDTEAALAGIAGADIGAALSLQNGVYKNQQLRAHFGPGRTLGATAVFSGELLADGAVRFTINESLQAGELPRGVSPRVQALCAALNASGIRAAADPEIESAEWSKFVAFVPGMIIAALTRLETWKTLVDPDLARLRVLLQSEMSNLAAAEGVALTDLGIIQARTQAELSMDEAVADLRRRGELMQARGATAHKVSTLQDIERGRRIEVEEILGHALRLGRARGLAQPGLEHSYLLLTGINRFLG